ncbi:TonB-dependent receptor [Novosphingobium profundi]|uniref:TonB-dependent receptor domain-containing protein n=1 Tax=Novosphingobium profundi TaxID=1774954 RepID=UPI001BD9F3B2|nr:TonB-dependent receptor [Novosphingobium profundi]MBT0667943.1 TonB-dependent receptor [Novosphingobium profundi]
MRPIFKNLLHTTCLAGLIALPVAAHAADADSPSSASDSAADDGNAIVVTGSLIKRPNAAAAAPILSVTNEAIKAQAAVNIEEVLNRLPQFAPDSQQGYQDSDGRQRIKLRNLGFERTLVLVDGRRLGTMNGEDVGMIPTALVKRVDVLTGGASAVYGSDAIAGVVNFIMDDNFEGLQLNANYNFYLHNNRNGTAAKTAKAYGFDSASGLSTDGGRSDISLVGGTKLFDDRLHIQGYVDYRKASLVGYGDRSSSACQLTQSGDGDLGCTTSTYNTNGYFSPTTGTNAGNAYVNDPANPGTFTPYSTDYAANPYDGYSLQRANERWNAGGFMNFEISPAATVYANAMWFRDRSVNPYPARLYAYSAYGSTPYSVSCDNAFLSSQQASTLCGSAAGTSATVPTDLRYRFADVGDQDDIYLNKGLRITTGVRGDLGHSWSYDIGGVYARNQSDYNWAYPNFDRINQAINGCPEGSAAGCIPIDIFGNTTSSTNQQAFNWLLEDQYGTLSNVSHLYDLMGTVQGDLGSYGIQSPWASTGVGIAFSVEYREDHLDVSKDDLWISYNGGDAEAHYQQAAWEGMVELQVPIVEDKPWARSLELNGAYRLSKYSGNPSLFSTFKAEAIWSPSSDITLRASFNRAQRAPTVVEQYQAESTSYGNIDTSFNDFCAPTVTTSVDASGATVTTYGDPAASLAVCEATGLDSSLYGSTSLLCPDETGCTYKSGGFTVDPETAYTKTIGLVLTPSFLPGLSLSVDRFLIDLDNSIGYNDYTYFTNGCLATGSEFFCSMFVRNSDGTLYSDASSNPTSGYIRQGTTNYYKSKSHGWDLQAQYGLDLGAKAGRLDFDFAGSLTTYAGGQDSPILAKYNCVGYYGGSCGQLIPKWTHQLRTTWTAPDDEVSISLNWRFVGPLTNVTNSGKTSLGWYEGGERSTYYHIPAYNYFDLAIGFRVAERFGLRFTVNNLFDKDPPVVPNSYSYALSRNNTLSARYDSLGRQVAISTTVDF